MIHEQQIYRVCIITRRCKRCGKKFTEGVRYSFCPACKKLLNITNIKENDTLKLKF